MSGSKKAKAGQGLRDIDQPIYRYYQALFLSFFFGKSLCRYWQAMERIWLDLFTIFSCYIDATLCIDHVIRFQYLLSRRVYRSS